MAYVISNLILQDSSFSVEDLQYHVCKFKKDVLLVDSLLQAVYVGTQHWIFMKS